MTEPVDEFNLFPDLSSDNELITCTCRACGAKWRMQNPGGFPLNGCPECPTDGSLHCKCGHHMAGHIGKPATPYGSFELYGCEYCSCSNPDVQQIVGYS